jgi:hypothetical protein
MACTVPANSVKGKMRRRALSNLLSLSSLTGLLCRKLNCLYIVLGCLGRIGVQVSVPLEHGEKLQGKGLVLAVPALAAVFLQCAHHENIDKVQRLFGHFIEGVAFDEEHIFVGEVHMEMKREISVFRKGPLIR